MQPLNSKNTSLTHIPTAIKDDCIKTAKQTQLNLSCQPGPPFWLATVVSPCCSPWRSLCTSQWMNHVGSFCRRQMNYCVIFKAHIQFTNVDLGCRTQLVSLQVAGS